MTYSRMALQVCAVVFSLVLCALVTVDDHRAHARPTIDDDAPVEPATPGLVQLDDASFVGVTNDLALTFDYVLMEFYSHWCPACKAFQPTYKEIAMHLKTIMDEEDVAWGGIGVPPQSASRPVRVAVARVDCPENTALCDTFRIHKYPTLYLDRPMAFGSLAADSQTKVAVDVKPRTKDKVLKRMGEIVGRSVEEAILPEGYIQSASNGSDGSSRQDTVPQDTSLRPPSPPGDVAWPSTDCDVKGDVTIATIEMFEYLKSKTVLGTFAARKALMDWLGLLETSHLVEECAAGAGEALRVLKASWPVSSEQILDLDALKQVKICGKEQKRPYVSCAGSTPETRGYTCGLWMLFHSLSVRMPMVSEGGNDGKRWMEVLEGYIKHFFQCSDCAEHFLQELQGSDARMVSTKRDAVLWLWKTHNRVNERLVREDASGTNPQDPVYKHVQWPLEGVCGTCYESTGGWNEEGVLKFLSAHYYGLSDQATNGAGETGKVTAAPPKASITWPRVFVIVAFVFLAVYHGLKSNSVQYGPIAGRRAYRSTKGR